MNIKCPSCNKKTKISKTDMLCQKCGYTITKNDIKSILSKQYDDEEIYDEFSKKNINVAGMLCLCFGTIGVHRFYLGKYFTGTLMFLLNFSILLLKYIGLGYTFWLYCILYCWIIADILASYYGVMTDVKGKLLKLEADEKKSNPVIFLAIFAFSTIIFILVTLANIGLSFYVNAILTGIGTIIYLIKTIHYYFTKN